MDREAGRSEKKGAYRSPVRVGTVLLAAGVAVAMIQYKVPTILSSLMALFAMDAEAASWLMSIFTLASVFAALPSGLLAQRFGAKNMMVAALGIAVTGSCIGLAAGSSAALVASRAVEGVALTILTTCGPLVVRACVDSDKVGTAMGIWGVWGCVGSTAAAVVTPTVFEAMGFAGVWTVFAVGAVLAAVLVLAAIRMPRARTAAEEAKAAKSGAASGRSRGCAAWGLWRMLLTRDILLFLGGFAMFNVCLLAVLSFVPTILQMQGVDPTWSGLVSTAPMLLSVASSPLFGAISDRRGRRKALLVAASAVMGPCTFLLYTDTGALMLIAVAVMGLVGMGGVGLFLSGFVGLVPRPELASVGMGLMVTVQGVGQFLGTFLVQMLLGPSLDHWFLAGGVLMGLGLAGTILLALCRMR
ncbi:CynX/NimT family MFS transporter [Gordonibacter urolithinfaciens]|uniref:MFS transporter n=1 Tax=Gordonibacter urolithinfaciens TaxID=1335613 RepID=A0A423UJT5_9ACTN|nr:MFS transporter [Gordonibacter urolithinfaciens]ROT89674.1 MFS transporter [Gordonibacter urolithinfaciens]